MGLIVLIVACCASFVGGCFAPAVVKKFLGQEEQKVVAAVDSVVKKV